MMLMLPTSHWSVPRGILVLDGPSAPPVVASGARLGWFPQVLDSDLHSPFEEQEATDTETHDLGDLFWGALLTLVDRDVRSCKPEEEGPMPFLRSPQAVEI